MKCSSLHRFCVLSVTVLCVPLTCSQMLEEDELKLLLKTTIDGVAALQEKFGELQESIGSMKSACRDEVSSFKDFLVQDECSDGTHNCSEWATCTDGLASYKCTCLPGFLGDGINCTDIDECQEDRNLCGANEKCVNNQGAYECQCQDGYEEGSSGCQDIDECKKGLSDCNGPYTCVNTEGGFECQCLQPYELIGTACENVCKHPSLYIDGLGCIKPILSLLNWEDAKTRCESEELRLLENIKKEHFEPISSHFYTVFEGYPYPWVGFKEKVWITNRRQVPTDLVATQEGELDGSCGFFDLRLEKLGLWDGNCSYVEYPLCQPIT